MTTNHSDHFTGRDNKPAAVSLDLFHFTAALPFSFCLTLQSLVEDCEVRMEDLADATGIHHRHVRNHLAGLDAPTAAERSAYAGFFGMTDAQFDERCRYHSANGRARVELTIDAIKLADAKARQANQPTGEWIARVIEEA